MFNARIIITQVLNNNVVLATKGNQELIAIGNGIGFRHGKNEVLSETEIVKSYYPNSGSAKEKLLNSINSIPFEMIETATQIASMAEERMGSSLNENVVLALADHMNYAISRYKSGINIPIIIDEEVKRFYKQEYEVGLEALRIINERFNVVLNPEEASAIAFHIINATEGSPAPDTLRILEGVSKITEIISNDLDIVFDENSLDYSRLIIHLRFLLKKITVHKDSESLSNDKSEMFENLLVNRQILGECLNDISEYCAKTYDYKLTENDKLYLLVHIMKNE